MTFLEKRQKRVGWHGGVGDDPVRVNEVPGEHEEGGKRSNMVERFVVGTGR